MTRARTTTPTRRRSREVLAVLAVYALAALAGLVAAHFGTHRAWETSPPRSGPASVPIADLQRNP